MVKIQKTYNCNDPKGVEALLRKNRNLDLPSIKSHWKSNGNFNESHYAEVARVKSKL